MFKRTLFLIGLCSFFLVTASDTQFFQTLELCSEQQLSDLLKEKSLDMCWGFGEGNHFRFISCNDEVYFEVCLDDLSEQPHEIVSRIKEQCIQTDSGKWIFSYSITTEGDEKINQSIVSIDEELPDNYSYTVAMRRVIEDANPILINQVSLEKIIQDHSVLFYTGAGVSLSSNVPAMSELEELLGFKEKEAVLTFVSQAIESPGELVDRIKMFHQACLYSAPTPAHYALKEMSLYKNSRIITENLDCLHEMSGISPYRIDSRHLQEEVGGESMAQYDYIICIGLSFDDRGFLGWYKEHHPEGKILAIDLYQPSYLDDEDYWICEDLQTLIPSVRNTLLK